MAVGVVTGIHGVDGELKVRLSTDDPDHLKRVKRIYLGDETQTRRLIGLRMHQGIGLMRIGGVTTPEVARTLVGQTLRISGKDARPLKEGEFYFYQVIGSDAFDESGELVGVVKDILETGANDVFVIADPAGGQDLLLPNIPDCVLEIDPSRRRVVVRKLRYWDER